MIQLFGSLTSPYVRHCRIALHQENISFELVKTDMQTSAEQSPAKRVPYLKDGDLFLTDSLSILHHVRTLAGKPLFGDAREAERYTLADTVMDTAVNIFLLERSGITEAGYLDRQRARVITGFEALENLAKDWNGALDDGWLRLGCLLTWVQYRERYDLSRHPSLIAMDQKLDQLDLFKNTAPPPQ